MFCLILVFLEFHSKSRVTGNTPEESNIMQIAPTVETF
jgi:hypothetical protein